MQVPSLRLLCSCHLGKPALGVPVRQATGRVSPDEGGMGSGLGVPAPGCRRRFQGTCAESSACHAKPPWGLLAKGRYRIDMGE